MTSTESIAALKYSCPLCLADPEQPCRSRAVAGHEGGRPRPYPHTSRRRLAEPPEERARYRATYVKALCCVCGEQRTVSSDYSHRNTDPNYHWGDRGKAEGWRQTATLKCVECGERTRHAVLADEAVRSRDWDEVYQRYTLGGEWVAKYEPDRESLRREYFALFPRNPNLTHRFYIEDATKAWDAGEQTTTALCGATDTIDTDPRTWGKPSKKKARQQELYDGFVVAEQISDIEYTDVDTGLEWIDMDCVDCCRVSNDLRRRKQRDRLRFLLVDLAARSHLIRDADVGDLLQALEGLYDED